MDQLPGKDVDAIVKINFKRRAYKGKQRQDDMKVRLVALYNDEDEMLKPLLVIGRDGGKKVRAFPRGYIRAI